MLLNCVSKHFNDGGSVVYAVALNLSKAFNRVNHYGLFIKLKKSDIPVNMLNTFVNWYGKLQGQVRWSYCLSSIFNIKSGV